MTKKGISCRPWQAGMSRFAARRNVVRAAVVLALAGVVTGSLASAQVLEEVVVTAQLREENIQDVPVAVSAVSGAWMSANSIKDLNELMTSVPSLVIGTNQSASTGNFAIRGVGTGGQNFGLESSVGLYVDGIYRARQSAVLNQLVDVEAVEVLRGPQGTLFGKNSASGALLVRSVAPRHEHRGFIEVTAGNYDLRNLNAAYNYPLGEKLAGRTTLFTSERDGFIEVANLGGRLNDRSRRGLRQQFLYEGDDLRLRLILDHAEVEEACCAALAFRDSFVASARTNGGTPVYGSDAILAQLGGTVYRSGSFGGRALSLNAPPNSESDDSGVSLQLDLPLGRLDFVSLTAWRRFDTNDFIDADFSDVDLVSRHYGSDQDMLSQEFRLSGSGERLRWLGGLYFYRQQLDSRDLLSMGSQLPAYAIAASPEVLGKLMATPAPLFDYINTAYAQSLPRQLAAPVVPGNTIHDSSEQDHRAEAIFGRIDLDLSERLELNLGLRYTDERKTMRSRFRESVPTPGPDVLNATAVGTALAITGEQLKQAMGAPAGDGSGGSYNPVLAAMNPVPHLGSLQALFTPGWASCRVSSRFCPLPDIGARLDDSRVTGNIGLSWRVDDQTLVYASWGTGYKSGGTNTDRIGPGFDTVFASEDTTSVELGLKRDFASGLRANLALYSMEVEDLQTNTFTGTAFNLQNAGRVEVQGFEAELWWQPTDQLDLRLAYAWTDARFEDFDKGNCQLANIFHTGNPVEAAQLAAQGFCSRSGDRVSNTPEHFLSLNASRSFLLDGGRELELGAEYVYYSDQVMHNSNDPFARQPAVDLLNLRARLSFNHGIEALLWVRNATDEDWYGTVIDTPLQDGKLSAYPREPRTFGLSLRKDF